MPVNPMNKRKVYKLRVLTAFTICRFKWINKIVLINVKIWCGLVMINDTFEVSN